MIFISFLGGSFWGLKLYLRNRRVVNDGVEHVNRFSARLRSIQGRFHGEDLRIFSIYAPDASYEVQDTELFYKQLSQCTREGGNIQLLYSSSPDSKTKAEDRNVSYYAWTYLTPSPPLFAQLQEYSIQN
jgi:hypothetical protein